MPFYNSVKIAYNLSVPKEVLFCFLNRVISIFRRKTVKICQGTFMMDTVARTRSRFRIRITDMHQERPPLCAFLSFEWGNLSPYGILSILAIYQVSCLVTEKWFLHAIDPYFLLHFWQQHCMFWYHYLHVFCFKMENKGVCLLLFGTPECGSRVSLGEYVPYYRLCLVRFPPKSFRDSKNLFMSFSTIFLYVILGWLPGSLQILVSSFFVLVA